MATHLRRASAPAGKDKQRERYEKEIEAARLRMLARAKRKLRADEAEDAVQDALVKAFEKVEWREIVSPANWIMGVMDNVILATVRQRRSAVDLDVEAVTAPTDRYEDALDRLARDQEVAEQMSGIARLAAAVNLNEREWYVVEARLQDKGYGEIGEALGIGINAARAYHSQAVGKLRAAREGSGINLTEQPVPPRQVCLDVQLGRLTH